VRLRDAGRFVAYAVLALSLAAAVLTRGGVDPAEWQWIAAAVAFSSLACVGLRTHRASDAALTSEERILAALAAWMLLALAPLPPSLVSLLSPLRAQSAQAARALVGADPGAWLPLSVAPPATLDRLLFVLPAMAVFVAAREMPRWWSGRGYWIAVAPVIAVAVLEAVIGLTQFFVSGDGSGGTQRVTGTYVNRNHYAGLLELAFPLALALAASLLVRPTRMRFQRGGHATGAVVGGVTMLAAAACLLVGVLVSASRMGLLAMLMGLVIISCGWLVVQQRQERVPRWLWVLPFLFVLVILLFGSTTEMVLRLGEALNAEGVGTDGRRQLWGESWRLFRAYPLTGAGLGTFEQALYPFRSWLPTNTVAFAHNDFLQVLAESGVVGFVLAMALAVSLVRQSVSVWRRPGSPCPWLGLGLLAAFMAAGLHSLVDFNLYIPANALALAWLAGVAVSPALREANG
jgi:O-antigen ligase